MFIYNLFPRPDFGRGVEGGGRGGGGCGGGGGGDEGVEKFVCLTGGKSIF